MLLCKWCCSPPLSLSVPAPLPSTPPPPPLHPPPPCLALPSHCMSPPPLHQPRPRSLPRPTHPSHDPPPSPLPLCLPDTHPSHNPPPSPFLSLTRTPLVARPPFPPPPLTFLPLFPSGRHFPPAAPLHQPCPGPLPYPIHPSHCLSPSPSCPPLTPPRLRASPSIGFRHPPTPPQPPPSPAQVESCFRISNSAPMSWTASSTPPRGPSHQSSCQCPSA